MSALGQKQTFAVRNAMSALPLKADIRRCKRNVSYGPTADIRRSLTIHRDNKFNWIIECDPGWNDCATSLQVTPLQRAVDAVEDEDNALLRSFDPHFHEALEEGCAVEIEDAGKGLNAERPCIKPLYPVPERLFP